MFRLRKITAIEVQRAIDFARGLPPSSPPLLTVETGLAAPIPRGFAHDQSSSLIGTGEQEFDAACEALDRWIAFELDWVRVANADAPIATGQVVAVEAHTLGLWSLNLSVITEVVRTGRRFGFLYTTTRMHIEQGQERFVLSLNDDGSVTYMIEAVSRPRATLARLGYPITRFMQHRFARHSHERMWRAVAGAAARNG